MEFWDQDFKRYENMPNEYLSITAKMEEWGDYPIYRIVSLSNANFEGVVVMRRPLKGGHSCEIKMRNRLCFKYDDCFDEIKKHERLIIGLDGEIEECEEGIITAKAEKRAAQANLLEAMRAVNKLEYA